MSFAVSGTLMAAGAGMNMVGAMNSAKAQKNTLNYEAAVASNNQTIANHQADQELQVGAAQEQAQRLRTAATMGDQRAALAANGVDLGTGSAAEVLGTTQYMGERDALTLRDNAARQAWATREQAKGYGAEAAVDAASASAINPTVAGLTSLLGSASSVSSAWMTAGRGGSSPGFSGGQKPAPISDRSFRG